MNGCMNFVIRGVEKYGTQQTAVQVGQYTLYECHVSQKNVRIPQDTEDVC